MHTIQVRFDDWKVFSGMFPKTGLYSVPQQEQDRILHAAQVLQEDWDAAIGLSGPPSSQRQSTTALSAASAATAMHAAHAALLLPAMRHALCLIAASDLPLPAGAAAAAAAATVAISVDSSAQHQHGTGMNCVNHGLERLEATLVKLGAVEASKPSSTFSASGLEKDASSTPKIAESAPQPLTTSQPESPSEPSTPERPHLSPHVLPHAKSAYVSPAQQDIWTDGSHRMRCTVMLAAAGEVGQPEVAAALLRLLQDCGRLHMLSLPSMLLAGDLLQLR